MTLVAARDIKSRINQTFLIFSVNVFLYISASFVGDLLPTLNNSLWSVRTALMLAEFIPLNFYLFTLAFTKHKPKYKWGFIGLYALTPIMAASAFFPQSVKSVQSTHYGVTFQQIGPLLWATLVFIVAVFILCFWILYRYSKESTDNRVKLQIRLIIYSVGLDVFLNVFTQIALPEFHIYPLGNLIGVPSNLLFVGAIGYAILRHKMFDVRAAVLRTVGYLITVVSVLIIYGAVLLGLSELIFPKLSLTFAEDVFFVVAVIILAITFRPLIRLIEIVTDKIFFRDSYRPQELLNQISHMLAFEIRLDVLSRQICELLNKYMRTQTDIIILDAGHIYFETQGFYTKQIPSLQDDLVNLGENMLITDDLPEGTQKDILRKYSISVMTTLKTHNEKIGYLLLSDKDNGSSYGRNEISIIKIIADELAIGFQNSRSFSIVQKLSKRLQDEIDQATEELKTANEKLKKSDEVKDDFISMASHQLSTPLAVIDGYLTLANQGVYGKLNDKLARAIKAAAERASVMKSLLVDLLDISRMTAGKFVLQIAPGDLDKIVEREFSQLKDLASEKSVHYTYHKPKNVIPELNIDSQKTGQAVMNLIHNALHYAAGKNVDVYLESDSNYAIFRVVDNGIGVPEAEKTKLFTKFYRAENARKERPNGTGIGLYLVKRVVEDQGGIIIFISTQDKGSTFGFKLPLSSAATEEEIKHDITKI